MKRLLLCLVIMLFGVTAYSQVSISPTYVILGDNTRFGSFLVLNNSNQAQEVTVSFQFGYPDVDSTGIAMSMIYDHEENAAQYSITEAVRAFPRSFTVAPQQRQLVRITARPEQNLEDGTYWTRIKTLSSPQAVPVGTNQNEGVSASINFQLEQITTLLYKKGTVTTGLNISDIDVNTEGDVLSVTTKAERTGNSPFLGNLTLRIYNSEGDLVLQDVSNISVYFDYTSTFTADMSNLEDGSYRAVAEFNTNRSDISSNDIIKSPPVSATANFEINR